MPARSVTERDVPAAEAVTRTEILRPRIEASTTSLDAVAFLIFARPADHWKR